MTEVSPFAAVGARLVAAGFSPIPIVPGDKKPGRYANFAWQAMGGWSKFCSEAAPAFQVAMWQKWPDAGVGVALGRGVICVDIDGEFCLEAIKARLPEAVVGKRGHKGESLFFRADTTKVKTRSYRIDGQTAVDLLAHGRQTVVPPSIHPRTGSPYTWTTALGLDEVTLADLTVAPDNLEDIIAEVLTPFGYVEEKTYTFDPANVAPHEDCEDGLRFYREMNERALAHLSAWVPALGLPKCRPAGPGKFEAVASWRSSSSGRPDSKRSPNLKFHALGIKDMGTNETHTALNVVMKVSDATLNEATKWLGERLGYNFEPAITFARPEMADSKPAEMDHGDDVPTVLPEPPAVVVEAPLPAVTLTESKLADVVLFPKAAAASAMNSEQQLARDLDELTRPPGLVGDIVDWIAGSSRRPSRILALAAALSFVGALAGRMYESPTELRTNTYLVSLAATGFGKEHARKALKKLAAKTNLTRFIGAERIMSASALRTAIEHQSSLLYALDEFGGFMKELNDSKSGSHVKQIRDLILSLVGAAESYYSGADYADRKGVVVHNPNLSILGLTTPDDFWNAMTGAGVSDGLLPRFVIVPALGARPASCEPLRETEPPKDIVDECRRLVSVKPLGGPLAGVTTDGSTLLTPRRLKWAGESKALFAEIERECESKGALAGVTERDLWSRAPANAQKLAMIVSIGCDFEEPEIWPDTLRWAYNLVSLCVSHTIKQVDGRLADNDRQREYLFVKMFILSAEQGGVTKTELTKRVNGRFDSKRLAAILSQLEDAGDIESRTSQNPNGGPISHRFHARAIADKRAA